MALISKWEKIYERLVESHYDDQRQVKILERQLRQFRGKRKRLQQLIENEGNNTEVWMRMMATMRREVERFQKQKHRLTPKNKKQLQKLLRQLPKDRFEDRVRLMEVSEKLTAKPYKEASIGKAEQDPVTSRYSVPSQQNAQPRVDKRLARIKADLLALQRINKETVDTMADIQALKTTIKYLNRGECTRLKITPYVARRNVLDLKTDEPENIKATIAMNRLNRSKRGYYSTRDIMDIRPPYILDHVPQLKTDTYNFLQMNSKRKH